MAQEFLNSKDLQEMTGIASSTWRWWVSIGEGPASVKIGRRRLWRRSTVEAWLREREAEAS